MNNWYSEELNAKYVQQQVHDELENRRIVTLALANQPRRSWFLSRLLLVVGCWLVARGWQLQQRRVEEQVIQWGSIEVRHSIGC